MSLTSTITKASYAGDAVSTVFSVPFVFYATNEIQLYLTAISGAITSLTLGTDYTVSGGNGTTGSVTMALAPGSGATLQIRRATFRTQPLTIPDYDPLPSSSLEKALDRLTAMAAEADETATRTLRAPAGEAALSTLPVKAVRANTYLAFDAYGQPTALSGVSGTTSVSVPMQPVVQASSVLTALRLLGIQSDTMGVGQFTFYGNGTTDDRTNLATADTVANNAGCVLIIDRPCAVGSNITFNSFILFVGTGRLVPAAGVKISFAQGFEARSTSYIFNFTATGSGLAA